MVVLIFIPQVLLHEIVLDELFDDNLSKTCF